MNITNTLDDVLTQAFRNFLSDLPSDWYAKERDCVSRFVFGYLINECREGTAFESPAQLGIEVAVKQPAGVGEKRTAHKDLVVWRELFQTSWDEGFASCCLFRTQLLSGRLNGKVRKKKQLTISSGLKHFRLRTLTALGIRLICVSQSIVLVM